MVPTIADRNTLAVLEGRIETLLPEQYQDCYEEVQPVSMGSAGLKFGPDGKVAWNSMWASFCDLAMAGGPPHKGTLLEPATQSAVEADPDGYQAVVDEICRGLEMVTDLPVQTSRVAGWVRMHCLNEGMAQWLLRAIGMENVAVRLEGRALELPAGPSFRIEKEIKNVVTVAAKTCHYWLGHTSRVQQKAIAQLFAEMAHESPLIEPAAQGVGSVNHDPVVTAHMLDSINRETGLTRSNRQYAGWLGVECPSIRVAIWMMRALVASNVLSRREDTTLFVPFNPVQDPNGDRVVAAVVLTRHLATIKGVL